jgi:hypothetical protein
MKLAVRATDLGGGQWRYDYALMNLDFDPRVKMFSVPLPPGAAVTDVGFHDADEDPENDWILTIGRRVAWRAPSDAATQDWSTLLSFHFTINAAPTAVDGSSAKLRSLEARALVIEPRLLGPGAVTPRPATRTSRSGPG